MEYEINLKDIKERIFQNDDGWSNYRNVSIEEMDWLVEQVEKLQETVRIYKVVDEHVKEQSKKVKHIFPLENTAGYGQLCDKVLELERKVEELSEDICSDCGKRDSWCVCYDS